MDNNQFGYSNNQNPFEPINPTPPPPENKSNGYAIASLALGIASICTSFLCCCFWLFIIFAGICGVLAIIFALVARHEENGKMPNMAIAGLVLGIVGIVLCLLIVVLVVMVQINVELIQDFYREIGVEFDPDAYT